MSSFALLVSNSLILCRLLMAEWAQTLACRQEGCSLMEASAVGETPTDRPPPGLVLCLLTKLGGGDEVGGWNGVGRVISGQRESREESGSGLGRGWVSEGGLCHILTPITSLASLHRATQASN